MSSIEKFGKSIGRFLAYGRKALQVKALELL
jgi:hypothetical protein